MVIVQGEGYLPYGLWVAGGRYGRAKEREMAGPKWEMRMLRQYIYRNTDVRIVYEEKTR